MFGVNFATCLRTGQPRIGAIKDGSFSIRKNVRRISSSIWILQDPILQRKQTYLQQSGVQIVPQSSYSPDLDLCDHSSSPCCKNTAGQKTIVMEKTEDLYIDAKRCINLTFKLALIRCSEHE